MIAAGHVKNMSSLIKTLLLSGNKYERSRGLSEYFVGARFRINHDTFMNQYADGKNDGGIDFYHVEENTFYIAQSKFEDPPTKTCEEDMMEEIRKINNTLIGENPNKRAEHFVNELSQRLIDQNSMLEIVWLTTSYVEDSVRNSVMQRLLELKNANGWKIAVDFVVFDRDDFERLVFDVIHGFIPYTGRRTLRLEPQGCLKQLGPSTNIIAIVCTVRIDEILRWFAEEEKIDDFLQKNIRGYLSKNVINKGIQNSYEKAPDLFWYKHNGIIIFSDQIDHREDENLLVLRNPQIVNGGQTVKALYEIFKKRETLDNPSEVLLRVYRLPYEHENTYKRSISIIEGLNSQNPIFPSDLRSNDMRQVRIESLMKEFGYTYHRRRSREKKAKQSTKYHIPMTKLAKLFYVCNDYVPHKGVGGHVEELFEAKDSSTKLHGTSKYDRIFSEQEINREFSTNHVVLKYLTVWNLYQILRDLRNSLSNSDYAYFEYTQYFVLAGVYRRLYRWKSEGGFRLSWKSWLEFIKSRELEEAVWKYAKPAFRIGREMTPKEVDIEEKRKTEREFFRSRTALEEFDRRSAKLPFSKYVKRAYNEFYERETT